MLIDFCVEELEEFEADLDWLEEELLSRKEEIKEDLKIHIDGVFQIERDDGYVYENFEIEIYFDDLDEDLDEDEEIENEIYKILDRINEMYEKIKKNEKFIKEFKEACS